MNEFADDDRAAHLLACSIDCTLSQKRWTPWDNKTFCRANISPLRKVEPWIHVLISSGKYLQTTQKWGRWDKRLMQGFSIVVPLLKKWNIIFDSNDLISSMFQFSLQRLNSKSCWLPLHVECLTCPWERFHSRAFLTLQSVRDTRTGQVRQRQHITLCANRLETREQLSEALMHEMVHAYDSAHGADLKRLHHLACSEIRAAIRAECNGVVDDTEQMKQCVREQAVRSTKVWKLAPITYFLFELEKVCLVVHTQS